MDFLSTLKQNIDNMDAETYKTFRILVVLAIFVAFATLHYSLSIPEKLRELEKQKSEVYLKYNSQLSELPVIVPRESVDLLPGVPE